MSNRPRSPDSEFLQAARRFDEALESFHGAAEACQRGELGSAKNLERAAQALNSVAEAEKQLGAASQALGVVLNQAREQQQEEARLVTVRAEEIARRTAIFQKLIEGFKVLGEAATMLNAEATALLQKRKELGDRLAGSGFTDDVEALREKMASAASAAEELQKTAHNADFEEIARQSDSVRQQLLAARNKLAMFGRS